MITAAVAGLENTEGLGHFSGKFIFARSLIVFVVVFFVQGAFFFLFEILDTFFCSNLRSRLGAGMFCSFPMLNLQLAIFVSGSFFCGMAPAVQVRNSALATAQA